MHYDRYLKNGYSIATGVIEGACRHSVKDRMEYGERFRAEERKALYLHRECLETVDWPLVA